MPIGEGFPQRDSRRKSGSSLMKISFRLGLMVGLLAFAASARANDEKIPLKDLPKAVTNAIKARFPKAEMTAAEKATEKGKTTYEVEFKDGDKTMEATLTAAGKFEAIETEVALADLPKAVTDAVTAKYPKGTTKSAEWVIDFDDDKETTYYEVIVSTGAKKNRELHISQAGKILSDDEEEDD